MIKEHKPSIKASFVDPSYISQGVFTGRKSLALSIPSQNFKKHSRKTSLADSAIVRQELFQKRRPLSSNVFSKPVSQGLDKIANTQLKNTDLNHLLACCKSDEKKISKKPGKVKKHSEPRKTSSFLDFNSGGNVNLPGQQQNINSSRFQEITKKLNFTSSGQNHQMGDFLNLLNKQIGDYQNLRHNRSSSFDNSMVSFLKFQFKFF